jgi:hypothetical protein
MKKKKLRDLIISSFLISSLAFGAFLVSCSEEDGFMIGPESIGTDPYPTVEPGTSIVSTLFLSLGQGAGREIGGQLTGWALSAMGLSAQSGPNYTGQLNRIEGDLDSMLSVMNTMSNELNAITNAVNNLNCGNQLASVDEDFGAIRELHLLFNSMLSTANGGDTVANATMRDWADQVLAINNYSSRKSVGEMLNDIKVNLETSNGALVSCMLTIPKPAAGSYGQDTTYYNKVNSLFTYLYYYQALAMTLITEANHYYAWVHAGSPGHTYTTADSVQKICTDNATSENDCNIVSTEMNDLFNELEGQVTFGGAAYTSESFLYQQIDENNAYVWVKSLEDYASATGHSCGSHMTNSTPCDAVSGYYYSSIPHDEYHYTKPLHFANTNELRNLIDGNKVGSGTNGEYLQSLGFRNMSGKTFIASDTVMTKFDYMINDQKVAVVPFFNTDVTALNTGHNITSVFMTENDFKFVLDSRFEQHRNGVCGYDGNSVSRLYHYSTNSTLTGADSWLQGYGKTRTCDDGTFIIPFEFTDHNYEGSSCCYPGFLALKQRQSGTEKRFLFPVLNAYGAGCASGRSHLNAAGVPTMCHHNFTEYLNAVLPKPLSCNLPNITPVCN